jgi:CheY-like chemotaxis protein
MKGAAGILGAKTIQCLADEVELACVGGDANRADDRLATLVSHLNALHSSAARAFEGAPIDSRSAPQTFAARDGTDTPSSESRRPDAEWRCRVLLVDDDDIVRAHLARLLELSGYRVGEVASGGEAVQAVRGGDYQIVISDWNMSGMSGLELCRELRVDGENHDLYVLMLTMGDRSQDVDLCRAAGADAYVLKSAPNEDILAHLAVARHGVQLRTSQGGTERSSRDGLLWKKIS